MPKIFSTTNIPTIAFVLVVTSFLLLTLLGLLDDAGQQGGAAISVPRNIEEQENFSLTQYLSVKEYTDSYGLTLDDYIQANRLELQRLLNDAYAKGADPVALNILLTGEHQKGVLIPTTAQYKNLVYSEDLQAYKQAPTEIQTQKIDSPTEVKTPTKRLR